VVNRAIYACPPIPVFLKIGASAIIFPIPETGWLWPFWPATLYQAIIFPGILGQGRFGQDSIFFGLYFGHFCFFCGMFFICHLPVSCAVRPVVIARL